MAGPRGLFYHCPCPPAHTLSSCVHPALSLVADTRLYKELFCRSVGPSIRNKVTFQGFPFLPMHSSATNAAAYTALFHLDHKEIFMFSSPQKLIEMLVNSEFPVKKRSKTSEEILGLNVRNRGEKERKHLLKNGNASTNKDITKAVRRAREHAPHRLSGLSHGAFHASDSDPLPKPDYFPFRSPLALRALSFYTEVPSRSISKNVKAERIQSIISNILYGFVTCSSDVITTRSERCRTF